MPDQPIPNNGLGRPVGAINRANRALKIELERFFTGPEYKASLYRRIVAGTAPAVEIYLLQMLYGKPRERVELTVGPTETEDLSDLSLDELQRRAEELTQRLREATELNAALPAEYRVSEPSTADLKLERPPSIPLRETPEGERSVISSLRDDLILRELQRRQALRTEGAKNTAESGSLDTLPASNPAETGIDASEGAANCAESSSLVPEGAEIPQNPSMDGQDSVESVGSSASTQEQQ